MAENTRKERGSKPSVTRHPLFALIVVLWFAALFGLTSLTIRPVLLEGFIAASGIDRVLTMTAAPLGQTARLLIVLAMTGLGGILGGIIARLVVRPASRRPNTAASTSEVMAQLSAEDDVTALLAPSALAEDRTDEEHEELVRLSRQLAVIPQVEADEKQQQGTEPQILSVAELPLKSFDEVDGIWLHADDRDEARPSLPSLLASALPSSDVIEVPLASAAISDQAEKQTAATSNLDENADTPATNGILDVYVRRANASAATAEQDRDPAPSFTTVPQRDLEGFVAPITNKPDHTNAHHYVNPVDRISSAPLDSLSHVELLDRLAQAIARRQAAATPLLSKNEGASFGSTDSTDVGRSIADAQKAAPSLVQRNMASPRGNAFNDRIADNDILISGFSALKSVIMQGPEPSSNVDEDRDHTQSPPPSLAFPRPQTDSRVGDTPLPSLENARKNASPSDQTEQALQAALTTLRRMSGAA